MATPEQIKTIIRHKYAQIATRSTQDTNRIPNHQLKELYRRQEGYLDDANLNLGCGIPTMHIEINSGDHILDLGCGSGLDCFLAAGKAGPEGSVTGIDLTPEMIARAEQIQHDNGFNNLEFMEADMEEIPLPGQEMDLVISNCAINMTTDKAKVFKEMHRMLRPGGQFCISDVVLTGDMPYKIRQAGEACFGCVAGAIDREQYIRMIKKSGFVTLEIPDEYELEIPDDILYEYADDNTISRYKDKESGIRSITISGYKAVNIKPIIGISGSDNGMEIAELLSDCGLPSNLADADEETIFSIQYRDQLVAVLSFRAIDDCGIITSIAVHPAFREQSLATLLLEHFVRDCQLRYHLFRLK